MCKKIGLILLNVLSLIYYFGSMFIYKNINNEVHYMLKNGLGLSIITLILIIILIICNCLALNGNKILCREDNDLKLGSTISLYLLNGLTLILIIYCIIALKNNLPMF